MKSELDLFSRTSLQVIIVRSFARHKPILEILSNCSFRTSAYEKGDNSSVQEEEMTKNCISLSFRNTRCSMNLRLNFQCSKEYVASEHFYLHFTSGDRWLSNAKRSETQIIQNGFLILMIMIVTKIVQNNKKPLPCVEPAWLREQLQINHNTCVSGFDANEMYFLSVSCIYINTLGTENLSKYLLKPA